MVLRRLHDFNKDSISRKFKENKIKIKFIKLVSTYSQISVFIDLRAEYIP